MRLMFVHIMKRGALVKTICYESSHEYTNRPIINDLSFHPSVTVRVQFYDPVAPVKSPEYSYSASTDAHNSCFCFLSR